MVKLLIFGLIDGILNLLWHPFMHHCISNVVPNISVHEVISIGQALTFSRQLIGIMFIELNEIFSLIAQVTLTDEIDTLEM
jgi:hypothetical protein